LDLIKEQKEVVAVTKESQPRKEVGTGYMDSSLSLHRLAIANADCGRPTSAVLACQRIEIVD